MADLKEILRVGGYMRKLNLLGSPLPKHDQNIMLMSGSVAMPQVNVLSNFSLTIGSMVASGMFGMILSITILPTNLWLVGIIFGSLHGYEVSKDCKDKPPTNILSRTIIGMG